MTHYDLAVIGAGPGGYAASLKAASNGLKVALIEKGKIGGACLNRGCVPTKSWVAAAESSDHASHMASFAKEQFDYAIDFEKVKTRQTKIVDQFVKSLSMLLDKRGVTVINGVASFVNDHEMKIEGASENISFDNAIIATGSKPLRLFEINENLLLDSDTIFDIDSKPESVLIIGAGYIGCEFAGALSRFGVKVTLVEALNQIIPMADLEVSQTLAREFKKQRISIKTNVKIEILEQGGDGVVATLNNGETLTASKAFVSVGRRFVTDRLNLDLAGVKLNDNGAIVTDGSMRTSARNIFAIGDVAAKNMLAYTAYREGIFVADTLIGKRHGPLPTTPTPLTIFTIPEIGSVGVNEQDAKDGAKIGRFFMRGLARAHSTSEISGFVKIIADGDTDKILGAHIIGARATDLIHILSVAMAASMTAHALGDLLFAHPAFSESILEAAHDLHGDSIHK